MKKKVDIRLLILRYVLKCNFLNLYLIIDLLYTNYD